MWFLWSQRVICLGMKLEYIPLLFCQILNLFLPHHLMSPSNPNFPLYCIIIGIRAYHDPLSKSPSSFVFPSEFYFFSKKSRKKNWWITFWKEKAMKFKARSQLDQPPLLPKASSPYHCCHHQKSCRLILPLLSSVTVTTMSNPNVLNPRKLVWVIDRVNTSLNTPRKLAQKNKQNEYSLDSVESRLWSGFGPLLGRKKKL